MQLKIEKDARNNSLPKKSQNRKKEKDDALVEERKTLVVQVNVHALRFKSVEENNEDLTFLKLDVFILFYT